MRDQQWEDRTKDVSCPAANTTAAQPAAAQGVVIHEGLHTYTSTQVALTVVGGGGLLEWQQTATKLPRTARAEADFQEETTSHKLVP